MSEVIHQGFRVLVQALEIIAAGAIVLGFILATLQWIQETCREGFVVAVERYRLALGRVIIIGLEILVAATIIKTVTFEPTLEGVSFIVFLVAIRTILGWATVLEMTGRWPWQKPRPETAKLQTND